MDNKFPLHYSSFPYRQNCPFFINKKFSLPISPHNVVHSFTDLSIHKSEVNYCIYIRKGTLEEILASGTTQTPWQPTTRKFFPKFCPVHLGVVLYEDGHFTLNARYRKMTHRSSTVTCVSVIDHLNDQHFNPD